MSTASNERPPVPCPSPAEHHTMSFAGIDAAEGRFDGVTRPYTEQDVARLRGSVKVEHTLAKVGAEKLWKLLKTEPYIHALGALSGNQVRTLAHAQPSAWLEVRLLVSGLAASASCAELALPVPAVHGS